MLLVLVSIPFLPRSNALHYYVSSEHIDNKTCTNGSTALRPCVSFDDLSSNKTFLSNKPYVKLLLLSKNYFISQNLTAENIWKLEIFPSGQWEEVSVKCEPAVQLHFHIRGLRMRSLSFTSCTLRYLQQGHSILSVLTVLTVDSCLFTKNTLNYAINVISGYSLNISINNCTFSSNQGALSVSGPRWSFGLIRRFTNLLVTDSVFSDNWRNRFNRESGFGGTSIYARDVNISIYRSQFLNNSAEESGGAIATAHGQGSLEIYDCLFSNNSARTGDGGAIKLFRPDSLVLDSCIFKYNFAARSGGAISSEVMDCYGCLFENNSARLLGGAIYTSTASNGGDYRGHKISIANSSFNFKEAGLDGGAVYCQKYPRKMDWLVISQTYSKSNSAARGGFLYLSDCYVSMFNKTNITESQAEHGGAIYSQDSRIAVESSFIVPIPGTMQTGFRHQPTTVMLAN